MKSLSIIFLSVLFISLSSCATREKERSFSEKEYKERVQKIYDSVSKVRESEREKIFDKEVTIVEKPIYVEIEAECDSSDLKQIVDTGGNKFEIEKRDGKILIRYKKDSTELSKYKEYNRELIKERDSLLIVKSETDTIIIEKVIDSKETLVVKTSWKDNLLKNLWFIFFIIIFVLWLFGFTPRYLFKLIKSKFFI